MTNYRVIMEWVHDEKMAQQIWMGLGEFALQEFKGRHIPQNGL